MQKLCLALGLTIILSLSLAGPVTAQAETVYVVQPGDTLTRIALRFNLTPAALATANGLSNPNLIFVGQRLAIPPSAPRNSPAAPAPTGTPDLGRPGLIQTYVVQAGDTLYRIAARYRVTVEILAAANNLADVNLIHVGQELTIPLDAAILSTPGPEPFVSIEFSASPVQQGRTLVVYVSLSRPASLTGDFEGRPLFFYGDGQQFWTLVGVHALADPGLYSLALRATAGDGSEITTARTVIVSRGDYGLENIAVQPGREGLLDDDVVQAEFDKVSAVWSQVTPQPMWEGVFRHPVDSNRLTSAFGTRRSYNHGPVTGFHTGTDFGAGTGTPVFAPAAGVVALAEPLTVRGLAVLIDHGLGLFSGYWHLSQIAVGQGQAVQPGDLIGYVGDTGLVTGAHLHWELRLNGIAVEPLQWTREAIP
ncbi:MAG: LysM peptidoglycan-binding domain-containing protein [Anaerolineae bacterium]